MHILFAPAPSPKGGIYIAVQMIGTDFLREVIETTILTGKVRSVEPVSLLLIAAPESGKTSVVVSKNCKAIHAFTDVTGRGIHQILKEKQELTHIVINDLVTVLSHKSSVNRYTISQINAVTEEGISSIATPQGIETIAGGKRGVITSLTTMLVKDQRYWWNQIGFTTRMLPFFYIYPAELLIQIKDNIDIHVGNGFKIPKKKSFNIPRDLLHVEYPESEKKIIREMSDVRSMILGEQGLRRLKQYHAMAQAHALWRNKKSPEVGVQDTAFVSRMDKFVSYVKGEPL